MGKRKSGLNIHGIILLDKRLGVSSNKALQEVRHLFNANKAGHTGALDPLATGLLPLCFGEATKVSGLMLDDDKRYHVTVRLGIMTDTGDAEGAVIKTLPVPALSPEQINGCLQAFIGETEQVPPMYSALKHNGKKLYELARAGETIERAPRRIVISQLLMLAFNDGQLDLDVHCSKGTYIRSLAEDVGHALGTCATVTALRRVQAGQFSLQEAYTLEQLQAMDSATLNNCLLPVDSPLQKLPAVHLPDGAAASIRYGQTILLEAWDKNTLGSHRIYHHADFLGLGEMSMDGKLAPKKLFNMNNEQR